MTPSHQDPSAAPERRRSARPWWVAAGVLAVGCLGVGAWAGPTLAENWTAATGASDGSSAVAPASPSSAALSDLPQDAATPSAAQVSAAMAQGASGFSGGTVSAQVVDARTGTVLYGKNASTPMAPASNQKILTANAVLAHTPAGTRYETAAYKSQDGVVLVAGGDTLLSDGASAPGQVMGRAGLATLARQTVAGLKGTTGRVTVSLDSSRFSGQSVNPAWNTEDVEAGYVAPIHDIALWDHHTQRPDGGEDTTHRSADAASEAQAAFVEALNEAGKAQGLSFRAGDVATQHQDHSGQQKLGAVESATVEEQVRYMLEESDNTLAEVLGRNAAVAAGREGSTDGAVATVRETLSDEGVDLTGFDPKDLCGLSPQDRVTATTLSQAVAKASQSDDARTGLSSFMPVAGGTGTLKDRFEAQDEQAARGWARAKTGTLLKVNSLTGYTVTQDGRLLAYSILVNDVTDADGAKNLIDRSVANLTGLRA